MSQVLSNVQLASVNLEATTSTIKNSEPIQKSNIEIDLEDGPLFRATIKEYEGKTTALKGYLKRIIKTATAASEAKRAALEQDKAFIESLREAPFAEPLFTYYLNDTWVKLCEQQDRLSSCMKNLLIDPLQKLYDLEIKQVDTKKKQFEDCSKEYYSNLSKYLGIKTSNSLFISGNHHHHHPINSHSTQHTHPSINTAITNNPTNVAARAKKIIKAESEFLNKKTEFDLVRFNYYSFLVDLHGGKKEQEILYHLLNYQEKQHGYFQAASRALEPRRAGLDQLTARVSVCLREQRVLDQEREEKRKELVSKYMASASTSSLPDDPKLERKRSTDRRRSSEKRKSAEKRKSVHILFSPSSPPTLPSPTAGPVSPVLSSPKEELGIVQTESTDRFKGIRDLEQKDQSTVKDFGRKKEGFLFATSKPSKSSNINTFDKSANINWHKYWCVVSGGQLHEYSNWKKQLETHIEPINLRFATVREARKTDRRFCFEVITPSLKRMYQATSNEELASWISVISNAISSVLNGAGSCIELKNESISKKPSIHWRHAKSLSGALSGLNAAKDRYLKKKQNQNLTDKPPLVISSPIPYPPQEEEEVMSEEDRDRSINLLAELRTDVSNTICADCSAENPDWCSLNLGVLICIECSGIHRSMGTHVSKVRSLTLDSQSFTGEVIEVLKSLGNAVSNSIFEARAPHPGQPDKPEPTSSREAKMDYIRTKYWVKGFIEPVYNIKPMQMLQTAILENDIPGALKAIAHGADVNRPLPALEPAIFLIPKKERKTSLVTLPVLDVNGNLLVGQTIEVAIPEPSTFYQINETFTVRFGLHLALLTPPAVDQSADSSQDEASESSGSLASLKKSSGRSFGMAEFLFQAGADIWAKCRGSNRLLGDLIGLGDLVDDQAIEYLNKKNGLRGEDAIVRRYQL